MKNTTDYGRLAYNKAEELEEIIASLTKKIYNLQTETLVDPNDTEDEPYTPPASGTVITTGAITTIYPNYTHMGNYFLPYFCFTCEATTTLIVKLTVKLQVISVPTDTDIVLYLDNIEIDRYFLTNLVTDTTYTIPFATSYTSTEAGHHLRFKVEESTYNMSYKVLSAEIEILGNNVDFINPTVKHTVHYSNGQYYISKIENGNGYLLTQAVDCVDLDQDYVLTAENITYQKFCHSNFEINGVWQNETLCFFYSTGMGTTRLSDYNDQTNYTICGNGNGVDLVPNLSSYYCGVIIFANISNGSIAYSKINRTITDKGTYTIDNSNFDSTDKFVMVTAVKTLDDSFNDYPKEATFVATRKDGINYFVDNVEDDSNITYIGYGTNINAYYANPEGTLINIYMRAYTTIVKTILTKNTGTNLFEVTSQTSIGTWNYYHEGNDTNYFTVKNEQLLFVE